MTPRRLRIAFAMDTTLGWQSVYANWRAHFPADAGIEPIWITAGMGKQYDWMWKVPGLSNSVKGRLRRAAIFRRQLSGVQADAIYAGGAVLGVLPGSARRVPVFTTLDATQRQLQSFHGAYGIYPSRWGLLERARHAARRRAYQGCRAIFAMSTWCRESLVQDYGVRAERVYVVPGGVELAQWDLPRNPAPDGTTHLLFVGGDFQRKGGELLLQWARTTQRTGWHLHLVTRQPLAVEDPRITVYQDLTPGEPRLRALYAQADAFVLPTLADCTPNAVLEAAAAGLPVVLSHVGGTGDLVRPGETGYLVPPGDAAALAQALEALIHSPEQRLRMGEAAREDARQRFDVRQIIRQTLEVMRECL